MGRRLDVRLESWPLKGTFRISRGAKTEAQVVVAEIADGPHTGRGEAVPYPRYDETPEGTRREIEEPSRGDRRRARPRGPARCPAGRRRPQRARLRALGPGGEAERAARPGRWRGWRRRSPASPR